MLWYLQAIVKLIFLFFQQLPLVAYQYQLESINCWSMVKASLHKLCLKGQHSFNFIFPGLCFWEGTSKFIVPGWLVGKMLGTTAFHQMQPDISTTILDKCLKGKSHQTPQHTYPLINLFST